MRVLLKVAFSPITATVVCEATFPPLFALLTILIIRVILRMNPIVFGPCSA